MILTQLTLNDLKDIEWHTSMHANKFDKLGCISNQSVRFYPPSEMLRLRNIGEILREIFHRNIVR